MALSKSYKEYVDNKGWSSNKFLSLALEITPLLYEHGFKLDWGRTVVKIEKNSKTIKIYCHYQGKSNDTISLVKDKQELTTFTSNTSSTEILSFILKYFEC